MKLQFRKLISLGLICTLLISCLSTIAFSAPKNKDEYIIMKSNNNGGYDISTAKMTSTEASKLRYNQGIFIVEKNGTVIGSEKSNEQIGYNTMKKFLKGKKAHRKTIKAKPFKKNDNTEWNMQQINADNSNKQNSINVVSGSAIKVCIIDSGVDFNTDIDVYKRKNFIPGQDDISVIYEDLCGHGTNVAGIISAKNNNVGTTGINSNVLLYSAKVLDANCQAPISRVVEAIYWAIEQKVNIINISFGTTTDSVALKKAIQDANDAGILIIAAAGNNGTVEYPAAYDEVMAIGSVDSEGLISDFSPKDSKIELVAPGELVLSTGDFGGVSVHSGTSMSAPHVTGLASILWQKDSSVSASFIRALLAASANLYGDSNEYGYGLVDLNYALEIYDDYKKTYIKAESSKAYFDNSSEMITEVEDFTDNSTAIAVFNDNPYVEGSWAKDTHEGYVDRNTTIKAIKAGATAPDRCIEGMTTYPQWHGYWQKKPGDIQLYESNYMASYIYLTRMALQWPNNTGSPLYYSDPSMISGMTYDDYSGLTGRVSSSAFCGSTWTYALTINSTGESVIPINSNIRYFMYGVALHSATDVFAHSTYTTSGNYISHTAGSVPGAGMADVEYYPTYSRYYCASYIAQLTISHALSSTPGSVSDFYSALSMNYDHSFYLKNCSEYASAIDASYYYANSSMFDYANIN